MTSRNPLWPRYIGLGKTAVGNVGSMPVGTTGPEQTVHRFEKHFFPHEVVKTGQYRDHQIEEVVDRCFVMFVTRFNKGRPRGFPLNKDVYVCEARYNEEKFKFNKIKTWASCLPDEVRDKDYEMDLFDAPRRLKKLPSPIKHLLREDSKETDELPKPTWGNPNAPPIIGAVHRRPMESNVSLPEVVHLSLVVFVWYSHLTAVFFSSSCIVFALRLVNDPVKSKCFSCSWFHRWDGSYRGEGEATVIPVCRAWCFCVQISGAALQKRLASSSLSFFFLNPLRSPLPPSSSSHGHTTRRF